MEMSIAAQTGAVVAFESLLKVAVSYCRFMLILNNANRLKNFEVLIILVGILRGLLLVEGDCFKGG
jgi:hypothetical protein